MKREAMLNCPTESLHFVGFCDSLCSRILHVAVRPGIMSTADWRSKTNTNVMTLADTLAAAGRGKVFKISITSGGKTRSGHYRQQKVENRRTAMQRISLEEVDGMHCRAGRTRQELADRLQLILNTWRNSTRCPGQVSSSECR